MQNFLQALYDNLIAGNMWTYLLDGLVTSLIVTFFSVIIGLSLGFVLALIRTSYKDLNDNDGDGAGPLLKIANRLASLFVTVIRGTPSMIQLLLMFNVFLAAVDNLILVCLLTFGLNSAAYVSEIFRAGIQSVPKGQKEAARSLGMTYMEMVFKIVVPQALKISLPALGNEMITLFKETSISGTIGLIDITRGAGIIISKTFKAAIPYFAAALIYLSVVLLLEAVFRRLERKNNYAYNKKSE